MAGGNVVLILGLHLVLTGLPGVAAALAAARRGLRSVPVLLAVGLAATGAVATASFWIYYADPLAGKSLAFFVAIGSLAAAGWALYGGGLPDGLLRQLAVPVALWALGSSFLAFLGFLHGGTQFPLETAATRFSLQLPSDNAISGFFAEWFYAHGHSGSIPVFPGEWLVSDRPPLQVGYLLSQRPFGWNELHYQLLGLALQQLWIVGLWALLLAARVGRVTRASAVIAVLLSDTAIVNGFFIWPKMLPAAMLLAAAALVATPLWVEVRQRFWGAALVAALLGIAMLGHGSSVFGVIPLVLIATLRGLPSWRWIGVGLLVGLAFMAPWSAFQKYADPPGNRLTKWMLAGVPEVDSRGTLQTILDSYGEVGVGGSVHDKAENFVTMAGGGPMVEALHRAVDAVGRGDLRVAVQELRVVFFFDLLPSLGLLLIAPLVMLAARRRGRLRSTEWSFALTCFAILAIGAVAWGLLLFGNLPARTVLHAGSFALPVLGLCGAVAGLRATFPRFAVYYVVVSALLMLAVYVPALTPPAGTTYSPLAIVLAAASLAGYALLSLRGDDAPEAAARGFEPTRPVLGDPRAGPAS